MQRSLHLRSNLKYLCRLRGWTQEDFATKFKVSRSLVGAWWEGRSEPIIPMFLQICKYFRVSPHTLYNEELWKHTDYVKEQEPELTIKVKKRIESALVEVFGSGTLTKTILDQIDS